MMLFHVVCTLNCSNGYRGDEGCTTCVLYDICIADNPCQNNAACVLQTSPDKYTCDCSGTNYIGNNCTGNGISISFDSDNASSL